KRNFQMANREAAMFDEETRADRRARTHEVPGMTRRALTVLLSLALLASCTSETKSPSGDASDSGVNPSVPADWEVDAETLKGLHSENVATLSAEVGQELDVDIVRYVTPEEWPRAQIDCLEEFGFRAYEIGQGGISF